MIALREITEFFKDTIAYIIPIIAMIIIMLFVFSFVPVSGNSMEPSLSSGSVVILSHLRYKYASIERNEIVVLKKKNNDGIKESYIKRIIGLPGEEIHYLDGYLYIDGKKNKEQFLPDNVETSNFMFVDICNETDCPDGKIPENKYLVLGDNRKNSTDSRTFGLVDKSEIEGKVIFNIWPLNSLKKI